MFAHRLPTHPLVVHIGCPPPGVQVLCTISWLRSLYIPHQHQLGVQVNSICSYVSRHTNITPDVKGTYVRTYVYVYMVKQNTYMAFQTLHRKCVCTNNTYHTYVCTYVRISLCTDIGKTHSILWQSQNHRVLLSRSCTLECFLV